MIKKNHFQSRSRLLCEIKSECQSCKFINEDYNSSLKKKEKHGLKLIGDIFPELKQLKYVNVVKASQQTGYRCHAKLAVRPSQQVGEIFSIGLYKPGSHETIDVGNCPVHHHSIKRCLRKLKPILESSSLTPYDEKKQTGILKYLAIRTSHVTSEIMITFVTHNQSKKDVFKKIINELKDQGISIHSAYLNHNPSSGNRIFSREFSKITAVGNLRERLADLSFQISPGSFFQINPWQAENIYRRVEQHIGPAQRSGASILDLYCGMGPFSLIAARLGYKVIGIEENPDAIENAKQNAINNNLAKNVEFICSDIEKLNENAEKWSTNEASFIIANPSRSGLGENARQFVISQMQKNKQSTFYYISCDLNSLCRDLAVFKQHDFKLKQIESFDMFAQTDKLEWLAIITL